MHELVYPDILGDAAFKRFLGSEETKHFLMAFLNTLLPAQDKIRDFTFVNTEEVGDLPHHRTIIFDLRCTTSDGRRIIIEVQRTRIRGFVDRAIFYLSRLYQRDTLRGSEVYDLVPTYLIALLDFKFDNHKDYVRRVELKDQNGVLFSEKLRMYFVELTKFNKTDSELRSALDQWLFTLKHMPTLTTRPSTVTDQELIAFYDEVRLPTLDDEGHALIRKSVRNSRDFREALRFKLEEGQNLSFWKSVRRMRSLGKPIAEIATLLDLSVEEVERFSAMDEPPY